MSQVKQKILDLAKQGNGVSAETLRQIESLVEPWQKEVGKLLESELSQQKI